MSSQYVGDSEGQAGVAASQQPQQQQQIPGNVASQVGRWNAINAVTRDKETDSAIFALGEAASILDDIDDVLAGFETDFSELLNADNGSITTTTRSLVPPPRNGARLTKTTTTSDDVRSRAQQHRHEGGELENFVQVKILAGLKLCSATWQSIT
jgi:hypothetical protein